MTIALLGETCFWPCCFYPQLNATPEQPYPILTAFVNRSREGLLP
jgi:hypothetical protein